MNGHLLNELRRIRVLKLEAVDRGAFEAAVLYRDEERRIALELGDRALLWENK